MYNLWLYSFAVKVSSIHDTVYQSHSSNSHSFTIQLYQRPYSYTLFCCTQLMLSLVRVQIRIYPPYSYAKDRTVFGYIDWCLVRVQAHAHPRLIYIVTRKDRTAVHSLVILSLADWSLGILTDVSSEIKLTLIHHPVTPCTVTIQIDGLWEVIPSCYHVSSQIKLTTEHSPHCCEISSREPDWGLEHALRLAAIIYSTT